MTYVDAGDRWRLCAPVCGDSYANVYGRDKAKDKEVNLSDGALGRMIAQRRRRTKETVAEDVLLVLGSSAWRILDCVFWKKNKGHRHSGGQRWGLAISDADKTY